MQILRYSINVTLDGCVDHHEGIVDAEQHMQATETIGAVDALIMGRVTYGLMEGGWRKVAETGIKPDGMPEWMVPFAKVMHAAKKYVVSDSMERADWNNAQLVRGRDLEATIRALKQQDGRGVLACGVQVPLKLAEWGLIDEYQFVVNPRIAGHGPRLLDGLSKGVDLRLVERQEFASGAVVLRYTAAG